MGYDPFSSYALFVVIAAKRIRERLHQKFLQAGFDISPEKYGMLILLNSQEGLSQQNIADKPGISKVAAFKLISQLEKRGLITRSQDTTDGRLKLVYLTVKGKETYEKLIVLAEDNLNECGDGMPPEEIELLKKSLQKIIANTQK